MVHPLILPGVLLATGIAALVRDHKNLANAQAAGAPPPLASLLETVRAADNAVVSRFKTDVAAVLLQALKGASLVSEPIEGEQGPRMLYKIVPSTSPTDTSANAAALAAQAEGFVVLASTVLVDLSHQGKKDAYLLFCRPADRKLANPAGHLALLLDAPDPAPRPVVTPPPAAEIVAGDAPPVVIPPAAPPEPLKTASPERAKKAKAASATVKSKPAKAAKSAKVPKAAVKTASQKPAQTPESASHHLNGKSVLVSSDPPAPADEVSA